MMDKNKLILNKYYFIIHKILLSIHYLIHHSNLSFISYYHFNVFKSDVQITNIFME